MKALLGWLASFRLRILFRTAFLLLALAVVAMAVAVLQEEKQRSYDNYREVFAKTQAQIVGRLRHPSGVLALLNPRWDKHSAQVGQPVVLPFSAIDFDDQVKVRNAVEMANCLVQFPDNGSLCVAVGNNPWAGGFIFVAGTFASAPLAVHRIGDEFLDGAHRVRVTVTLGERSWRWIAPFEPLPSVGAPRGEGVRGRFTGYIELDGRDYTGAKPIKEFRGWVWQSGKCLDASADAISCARKSFFSLRLPVESLREAIFQQERPLWPPADLGNYRVHVEVLPPGSGPALFDNTQAEAMPAFSLAELSGLLLPGESLSLQRVGGSSNEVITLNGHEEVYEQTSPFLTRLIRLLPVATIQAPVVELNEQINTPLGDYELRLRGDARSVNKVLSAVATRVSWFVGAMLGAIGLAWLIIEIGIIRRIALLTRRTRGLSKTIHTDGGLERYDLANLRGRDELGLLATALNGLIRRVKEDAQREQIRAEQEKDMWHAVGHEIMSPLQSLLALHAEPDDPSHRYISRMQQAVRILYGSASPSEAFESSNLQVQAIDIAGFLNNVADNAGIAGLCCVGTETAVSVRADEYSLEDVFSHILKNAERYSPPGEPITLSLDTSDTEAIVSIHNRGPQIPLEMIDKIFEYGVSDQAEAGAAGNRGQGLFVAKTYMAKMGGTVAVRNVADGVVFDLILQRVREKPASR